MLSLDILILILVIMLIIIIILTVIIFIVVIAIQNGGWVVDGYEQQGVAQQMGLSAK